MKYIRVSFNFDLDKLVGDNPVNYNVKSYNYIYPFSEDYKVGDLVLVPSSDYYNSNSIGVITGEGVKPSKSKAKPILYRIPVDDFKKRYNEVDTYQVNEEKRKVILKKLDEQYEESSKLALYEELAKNNPEVQKLLDELNSLSGDSIE